MKQGKTIAQQLKKLTDRKLKIGDYDKAANILRNVNYYTLTGYLFPFKDKHSNNYSSGASIELAIARYQFDNDIRNLLLSFVAEAEEKLKTRIAYHIAINHLKAPLIYTDIQYWKSANDYQRFMSDFRKNISNNKDIPFVKHHMTCYNGKFPIWVAVNLFTLGNIKYLYKNIPSKDRKIISRDLNLSPKTLDSWIDTLRILRNYLAHNMRLYGTNFIRTPKWEKHHANKVQTNKLFINFILLKHLLNDTTIWKHNISKLDSILENYSMYINKEDLGFPLDWKTVLEINPKQCKRPRLHSGGEVRRLKKKQC
ncbi:Abi family protein [Streptococcus sp. ZJ93]|uniref:Abi family protein n=1 Tax=Streptococcus handemini TaxID=3161188 RepID=UPI0032EC6F19